MKMNKIWWASCNEDCFGLWNWHVGPHMLCGQGSARQLLLDAVEVLALRLPIQEVMTSPLPRCPLSCCRRRGKTRDHIFASATSGAVKEKVQRDVRLHPGEHFINPKSVISFLFTTFKKHDFYCKVQQDSLNFGLMSLMLMSSLGHALNTCLWSAWHTTINQMKKGIISKMQPKCGFSFQEMALWN